jgi:DNA-binding PadR family transcriptional regulator
LREDKTIQISSANTLVLVILRDGSLHGYEIAREVERRSGDRISFNHGTLYPVLYALEKRGLIVSQWEQPAGERRRRMYTLTDDGRVEVERAIAQWHSFSEAINRVIEGA